MNTTHVNVPIEPTKGLLTSMAYRKDHSFGMNYTEGTGWPCGHTAVSRGKLLDDMRKLHKELLGAFGVFHGESVTLPVATPKELSDSDAQLYEEIVGMGFYKPEKEQVYAKCAEEGGLTL